MSENRTRVLPEGFDLGPVQGAGIIGDVTESLHRFLLDGWTFETPPPRIEEDLSFVPKDREEVVYVYMYRMAENQALRNTKQWRQSRVSLLGPQDPEKVYYERAPLHVHLFYLLAVHSKFRSEAERLLGWLVMRLHDATHLVYRPQKFTLPDGRTVDSTGKDWGLYNEGENVLMERVSLALVDDLTIGDAINFFTINEAPYRPYLTYRAHCSIEGALIAGLPTTVRHHRPEMLVPPGAPERPSGRIGRMKLSRGQPKTHIGPPGFGHRPIEDNESED